MDCVFCKISDGKIPSTKIWENENILAFLDINPINPGHTLIIPKAHIDNLFDANDDLYKELFEATRKLSHPLKKAMGAKKIGLIVEGFLVPHAHIHLVPLNFGGELDFRRAKKASPADLNKIAAKIRNEI